MYNGMDRDNLRWARGAGQSATQTGAIPPLPDSQKSNNSENFGSAHSGVFLMSFCDGSVQSLSFDIDPIMHGRLANRKDGEVVDFSTN